MYPGIRFPVIEIIVESRVRRSIPVSFPESSLHPVQGQHSGFRLRMLRNVVSGAFPCPVRELPVHLLFHAFFQPGAARPS